MQQPTLRSVKFTASTGDEQSKSRCLSWWFSAFGRGVNSILSVHLMKIEDSGESSDSASSSSGATSASSAASTPSSTSKKEDTSSSNDEKSGENKVLLWSIQSKHLDTRRNYWYYAQVSVSAETDHHILFQGEATDGGFALDDVTFYNGTCASKYLINTIYFIIFKHLTN